METNQRFDEVLDLLPEVIAHYGVKGMKWGVWNAETAARYSHAIRKRVKGAKTRLSKHRSNVKAQRALKRARRKSISRNRKNVGMDPIAYNELRKKTLRSNDPEVIVRGMHTLTDDELDNKLERLRKEDAVYKMAQSRAQDAARTTQAKNQAFSSHPLAQMGRSYADQTFKRILDITIPKPEKNKKNKGDKEERNNNNGNSNSSGNQNMPGGSSTSERASNTSSSSTIHIPDSDVIIEDIPVPRTTYQSRPSLVLPPGISDATIDMNRKS